MKALLISGLGPGHLETEDLHDSFMESRNSKHEIKKAYIIDGVDYSPTRLCYNNKGKHEQVLKKLQCITPDLISNVLQRLLKDNHIDFDYIDTCNIWDNKTIKKNVDIVCLSTTFMWSQKMLDHSLDWIKKNISFNYLILGGQYGTLKKDYLLKKYNFINYIIIGDAEASMPQLIKLIEQDKHVEKISTIPNVVYKNKENKTITTYVFADDLEKYPSCSFDGEWRIIPYISMKGCPYKCKFCALRVCTPKWRFLSAERIIQDWKTYKQKNKAEHIDINDSTFFIPFTKIEKLLQVLPSMNISWEANARADTPFTPKIIKKMEKSNCTALFFGFESMSDKVLKYMNKKTTVEHNKKINQLFRTSDIDTMMSFIVGFPGETQHDYSKTKKYLIYEHYGHYNIYIFEFEDESMPIWIDKDKYNLKIGKDAGSNLDWNHGGEQWSHSGMNSSIAKKLREETIREVRISESLAVHKTWQYKYQWPLIPSLSRQENLEIEKLIDKLIFITKDYDNTNDRTNNLWKIIEQLKHHSISI